MVALGKLGKIWLNLPGEEGEDLYKAGFLQAFGAHWGQLLVGAEKPFAYHLPWNGYFAVHDLRKSQGLTLLDLPPGPAGDKGWQRYNIIVG